MLNLIEQGDGRPIVFVHGLGGRAENWRPQLDTLGRSHHVLAVDLPGFGRSAPASGPPTLPAFADEVAAVLQARTREPAVVVGLSMGGMVTQELALRHPHLLAGIVLADTTATLSDAYRATNAYLREVALTEGMDPIAETLVQGCFTAAAVEARPPYVIEFREGFRATDPKAFAAGLDAINGMSLGDRIGAIAVPAAVVWGEHDAFAPDGEFIARTVPGIERTVLRDAAHVSNLEQPEAFNAVVVDLLRRISP
jgi:pimeloyl-ACP methyl ester carboxylesterase